MKKAFLYVLLVPVILLAGCAKVQETPAQEKPEEQSEQVPCNYVITATMPGDGTRVSYHEQTSGNNRVLHQKWQIDDHFFGFGGDTPTDWFELCVSSIENGVATLTNVDAQHPFPTSGNVHVFYLGRGMSADGFNLGNLPVDMYAFQSEHAFSLDPDGGLCWYDPDYPDDLNVPGILVADAPVESFYDEHGILTVNADLSFTNQTAIICIEGIGGLDPDDYFDRIELTGVRTHATWSIDDAGKTQLAFSPLCEEDVNGVSLYDYSPDQNGEILFDESPLFMAVFPRDNQDTEPITLRARLASMEEGDDYYYYTFDLGSRTIEPGHYYYISKKQLSADGIPVVRVYFDDNEDGAVCATLSQAFELIQAEASESSWVSIELLRDCAADGLLTLGGEGVVQEISVCLEGHTLTLNENYFTVADGQINLSFFGGTVVQSTGNPFLSVTGGEVWLDTESVDCSSEETPLAAPVTVSGTGSVHVMSGYFAWTSGPFAYSTSTVASTVEGGYFAISPTLEGNVSVPAGYAPAKIDNPESYIFFPTTALEHMARTTDGVLKTFTVDDWGYVKVFLTRNNVYHDSEGWHFEGPNWTPEGQIPNSDIHTNLFTYNYLKSNLDLDQLVVSGASYKWMNSSEWGGLLHHYANYQLADCFLKCKVTDGSTEWRNLLLFPDSYEWPTSAVAAPNSEYINKDDLAWSKAPTFDATEAEALLGAGLVFLPAAYPVTVIQYDDEMNEHYVFDHYDGYYWSSNERISYIFTDTQVGYFHQGDIYNTGYSLRLAIPAY